MKHYDKLVANERLKYLNIARRLLYPDVRAIYARHDAMLHELAKAIYVVEQLAKEGGGERPQQQQAVCKPSIWEAEV